MRSKALTGVSENAEQTREKELQFVQRECRAKRQAINKKLNGQKVQG